MSKQKLNPEELKNVLKNLNQCETTVVDNLIKIKDKYLSLDDSEIWLGPKSESFHESIRNYWNFSPEFLNTFVGPLPKEDTLANGNGAIIDNIQSDFKTLVNFINIAISKVTKTDEDVSKNIEGSTSNQTGNKTNNEKKEDVSEPGTKAPSATTPQTTKPAEPTTKPEESTTKKKPAMAPPSANSSSNKISYLEGTNYEIDTNVPCAQGTQYNLSEEDKKYLAYVVKQEQGSAEGAKVELSLIINRYEKYGKNYDNVRDYVQNSGWFASGSTDNYKEPPAEYVDAVNDVLVDGNRYLPTNVVEHDCARNIVSVKVNGEEINKNDRHLYVPYETVIENEWGAKYTFVGFAPTTEWGVKGDPFGYM